jgi:hypothetical protein
MNTAYKFTAESQPKIDEIESKFDEAQAEISKRFSELCLLDHLWTLSCLFPRCLPLPVKYSNKLHDPIFKERDELLKGVDKFWTKAVSEKMVQSDLSGS